MDYENVPVETQRSILRGRLENLETRHMQAESEKQLALLADKDVSDIDARIKDIEAEHAKTKKAHGDLPATVDDGTSTA